MGSATAFPSLLFLRTKSALLRCSDIIPVFNYRSPFLGHLRSIIPTLHASLAETNVGYSWSSPDPVATEDYGGWAIVDRPLQHRRKKGFPTYVIVGVSTSVAVLAAAIAYFSLSKKGFKFKFQNPFLQEILSPCVKSGSEESESVKFQESSEESLVEGTSQKGLALAETETFTSPSAKKSNTERVIISIAADSTQHEALSVLKKLKIIEDVKDDELCTRREYARWLVQMNSLLERNPTHRIIPAIAISGSTTTAFDDMSVEDADFMSVQALAEAGVIPSKLSSISNFASDGWQCQQKTNFSPDRFVSRQDLIDWKAQFEYEPLPGIIDQISSKKIGFMDVKEISCEASPALYIDMMAGDKSLLRKVFGQSKRFQPNKPSTKAQAAVLLTSGRITEAISSELSRLESESSARQATEQEIRSELLERGYIQRFWEEKLEEEKIRGCEVERIYLDALRNLEKEKINQDKIFAEQLKEWATVDCQKQLLLSLKEEIDVMSAKRASEEATYIVEKSSLQDSIKDLETKLERMLDSKSTLEAEKEAVQILRSWVEDEARRSQARAKVLEEVGQRWKWDREA